MIILSILGIALVIWLICAIIYGALWLFLRFFWIIVLAMIFLVACGAII